MDSKTFNNNFLLSCRPDLTLSKEDRLYRKSDFLYNPTRTRSRTTTNNFLKYRKTESNFYSSSGTQETPIKTTYLHTDTNLNRLPKKNLTHLKCTKLKKLAKKPKRKIISLDISDQFQKLNPFFSQVPQKQTKIFSPKKKASSFSGNYSPTTAHTTSTRRKVIDFVDVHEFCSTYQKKKENIIQDIQNNNWQKVHKNRFLSQMINNIFSKVFFINQRNEPITHAVVMNLLDEEYYKTLEKIKNQCKIDCDIKHFGKVNTKRNKGSLYPLINKIFPTKIEKYLDKILQDFKRKKNAVVPKLVHPFNFKAKLKNLKIETVDKRFSKKFSEKSEKINDKNYNISRNRDTLVKNQLTTSLKKKPPLTFDKITLKKKYSSTHNLLGIKKLSIKESIKESTKFYCSKSFDSKSYGGIRFQKAVHNESLTNLFSSTESKTANKFNYLKIVSDMSVEELQEFKNKNIKEGKELLNLSENHSEILSSKSEVIDEIDKPIKTLYSTLSNKNEEIDVERSKIKHKEKGLVIENQKASTIRTNQKKSKRLSLTGMLSGINSTYSNTNENSATLPKGKKSNNKVFTTRLKNEAIHQKLPQKKYSTLTKDKKRKKILREDLKGKQTYDKLDSSSSLNQDEEGSEQEDGSDISETKSNKPLNSSNCMYSSNSSLNLKNNQGSRIDKDKILSLILSSSLDEDLNEISSPPSSNKQQSKIVDSIISDPEIKAKIEAFKKEIAKSKGKHPFLRNRSKTITNKDILVYILKNQKSENEYKKNQNKESIAKILEEKEAEEEFNQKHRISINKNLKFDEGKSKVFFDKDTKKIRLKKNLDEEFKKKKQKELEDYFKASMNEIKIKNEIDSQMKLANESTKEYLKEFLVMLEKLRESKDEEFVKSLTSNFENFQGELKGLLESRKMEERINKFIKGQDKYRLALINKKKKEKVKVIDRKVNYMLEDKI